MVMYPDEWDGFMYDDRVRTFKKGTPADIIEKAKEINKKTLKIAGKNWFNFEEEEEEKNGQNT